jgi:hypothetical protein
MKSILKLAICGIACVACLSCAAQKNTEQNKPLVQIPPTVRQDEARPNLCIALSGGGIRAGAVALGVLQVFQKERILGQATYIASASS